MPCIDVLRYIDILTCLHCSAYAALLVVLSFLAAACLYGRMLLLKVALVRASVSSKFTLQSLDINFEERDIINSPDGLDVLKFARSHLRYAPVNPALVYCPHSLTVAVF